MSESGIGVLGALGILFVGLKLTGFIDWSWWWVTAPFWGGLAVAAAAFVVWLLLYAINSFLFRKAGG